MNEWYTQKEVAERLGVSKATVYHYAKQGKIRKMADPIDCTEKTGIIRRR